MKGASVKIHTQAPSNGKLLFPLLGQEPIETPTFRGGGMGWGNGWTNVTNARHAVVISNLLKRASAKQNLLCDSISNVPLHVEKSLKRRSCGKCKTSCRELCCGCNITMIIEFEIRGNEKGVGLEEHAYQGWI